MPDQLEKFDRIAKAIGNVCMEWGQINAVIHDIVLHLGYCVAPSTQDHKALNVLHIIVAHMDERERVGVAKALASELKPDISPGFYDKAEQLLNYVDNVVRPERNRYVHDFWDSDGEAISRFRQEPRVVRPQSRQYALSSWTERRYESVEAVEAFVTHLNLVFQDLVEFDNHLAWLLVAIEGQPSKSPQPLPPEWKSFAHRDWRGADTHGFPPRSSRE